MSFESQLLSLQCLLQLHYQSLQLNCSISQDLVFIECFDKALSQLFDLIVLTLPGFRFPTFGVREALVLGRVGDGLAGLDLICHLLLFGTEE